MLIIKVNELSVQKTDSATPIAQFRGKTYARSAAFRTINDAVANCRQDLDSGKFSLVVQEPNQFSVWQAQGIPVSAVP
ncbi:MAG: hypothetical protein OHK0012_25730 [Synechococcales cyanobacterium]